jgi:predicted GIY-YIG superfamily endonuclease
MRRPRPLPKPLNTGSIELPYLDENYVYRAYCQCGDLLYVGVTNSLHSRLAAHRRTAYDLNGSQWWRKAAWITWELYATREEAERVEAHAIANEDPLLNTAGRQLSKRIPRWRPLPELKPYSVTVAERAIAAHRKMRARDALV